MIYYKITVRCAHLDFSHVTTEKTKSISFKGTVYKKDHALLLDKNVVIKIVDIFVKHMTDVYFAVKCYQFSSVPTIGLLNTALFYRYFE